MGDYNMIDIAKFETIGNVQVPVDALGHYLDWTYIKGNKAKELTSPYGALHFAVGFDDDEAGEDLFTCFDFDELPDGRIILHAVVNSESGGFIDVAGYEICNKEEAPTIALGMIDSALEAIDVAGLEAMEDKTHDQEGWNQDPYFFYRCVSKCCGDPRFDLPESELRFGPSLVSS